MSFSKTERFQSKWAARMGKRSGAAAARSGLKRGTLRASMEGRGKLSLQTRDKPTGPANSARCNQQFFTFFYFIYCYGLFDKCAAASVVRCDRAASREGGFVYRCATNDPHMGK